MTTVAKTQRTTNDVPWLIGLAVLVIVGLVAWVVQLTQGLQVLGTNQAIVWGAYIATFLFLAGTGGGLMILTALADLGVIPTLQSHRRPLLLGALAAFIASGFMILMDIGQPLRVLNIIVSANLSSPFVWDFASLALSVIVAAIYLFAKPGGKWLPAIAGSIAALLIVVEGWILSMSAGSALWHGGMLPMLFLVEGVITASAIGLTAHTDRTTVLWLRNALLILLPILVVLNFMDLAAISYAGNTDAQAATAIYLNGNLSLLFWGHVLLGFALPFLLLVFTHENRTALTIAGVLMILGVLAAKLIVLTAGQAIPFFQAETTYLPTIVEFGGVIGVLGLAGLLFLIGKRLIPSKSM
jgi:molybdopterin-containing oxidoreductase family membrane subunit